MNKNNIIQKGIITSMIATVIAVLVITANIENESFVKEEERFQAVYIWTPTGGEGDPGSGASGWTEIFFMNLSDWTAGGYGVNNTATLEGWCDAQLPNCDPNAWASADNFDITYFDSETTFVIGCRGRFNQSHAWETDHWNGNDTNIKITVSCDDWVVGSNINNVSGSMIETANNTDYNFFYANWWWTNGGVGYQIGDDATLTTSEIYVEAKF